MDRKDAIEIIKKNWPDSSFMRLRKALETLIPELKESEESKAEEIIKSMTRLVTAFYSCNFPTPEGFERKDLLAWLKKQGEHANFRNKIQIGDKVTRNEDGVLVNLSQLQRAAKPCKSEQKPADKIEPKFKVGDRIIGTISNIPYYITEVCNGHYQTDVGCIITFYAQDNFKLVEQNPAWSEEDEKERKRIIGLLEGWLSTFKETCYAEDCKCGIVWLKSLKDRLQPQNLIVTDEELVQAKNDAYNEALDKIEYNDENPTFDDGWSAAIWYMKKRNAQPQTAWKPSNEQMKALDAVVADAKYINDIRTNGYEPYTHLYTLLQDLKKLRGE